MRTHTHWIYIKILHVWEKILFSIKIFYPCDILKQSINIRSTTLFSQAVNPFEEKLLLYDESLEHLVIIR